MNPNIITRLLFWVSDKSGEIHSNNQSRNYCRSRILLVDTVSSCHYPLVGDDGSSTDVAVTVIKTHLPGPSAKSGFHSSNNPR